MSGFQVMLIVLLIAGSVIFFISSKVWRNLRNREPGFFNLVNALAPVYKFFPVLLFCSALVYVILVFLQEGTVSEFPILLGVFAFCWVMLDFLGYSAESEHEHREPGVKKDIFVALSGIKFLPMRLFIGALMAGIFYQMIDHLNARRPRQDTESILTCFKRSPAGNTYPELDGEAGREAFAIAGVLPRMTEKEALEAMKSYFETHSDCAYRIDRTSESWTNPKRKEEVSYMTNRNYRATCDGQQYDIFFSVLNTREKVVRVRKISTDDGFVIDCNSDTRKLN